MANQRPLIGKKRAAAEVLKKKNFMSLDSKFLAQPKLLPVHFTLIGFVIITAQVQQPMQNQLSDFVCKAQAILFSLCGCARYGNDKLAQLCDVPDFKVLLCAGKRK